MEYGKENEDDAHLGELSCHSPKKETIKVNNLHTTRHTFFLIYITSENLLLNHNIWFIDQVWGQDIGMVLFFGVFVNQDGEEVHKLAKKGWGQYPAFLTEQAWLIKTLLEMLFKLIVKVPVVGITADTPNPPGLLPFERIYYMAFGETFLAGHTR